MESAAPFIWSDQSIQPDWIDYNGHLNMAYYMVLFDRCVDVAFEEFGLGPDYVKEQDASYYTMEVHITYLRELHLKDRVNVTLQLLDYDAKRTHFFQQMYNAQEGYLAATLECMSIHVDLKTGRSAPFPDYVLERIAAMHDLHKTLPKPEQVGNVIGIRRKKS